MSGQAGEVAVLDLAPERGDFRAELIDGLTKSPRFLPCKYFYDETGSELFLKICELPEYYITRTELRILRDNAEEIAATLGPGVELIGFGTGAGTKTRLLISHLEDPVAYIPVDISKDQLVESSATFSRDFPTMDVLPVCADYLQPLVLPAALRPAHKRVVYFPGSTIGNFEPRDAEIFLQRIAEICGRGGALLIGVDLQKEAAIIENAYNDSAGVTASFNLNILARANRELDANFDLDLWVHRAIYDAKIGRIEMHLISKAYQTANIGPETFVFEEGEHLITEFSYKYSVAGFTQMARSVGMKFERLWTDEAQLFGLFLFQVVI